MSKKLKTFKPLLTDEDAERAIEEEDLTEYDLSGFRPLSEIFEVRDGKVFRKLSLPSSLHRAVETRAAEEGVDANEFVRRVVEAAVSSR